MLHVYFLKIVEATYKPIHSNINLKKKFYILYA